MSVASMTMAILAVAVQVSVAPPPPATPDQSAPPTPPSAATSAEAFPPVRAKTSMRCTVTVAGGLKDCEILSETPPGKDFEAAALKTARFLRVKPATRNGIPVEAKIIIPMVWRIDPTPPGSGAGSPPKASAGLEP